MDDATRRRFALVDELKKNHWLTDPRVEDALRTVPRNLFLPDVPPEQVCADKAIPTKMRDGLAISSSSQPAIMAVMLEQLTPSKGEDVLEIGAGTGYNAALLASLVGETGRVTALDVDEDIVARARENLARANVANVEVICADGGFGYAANAPYDAIIATVGIWDVPPRWLEQLRSGGRLVLPLSFDIRQYSTAFKQTNDLLVSQSITPCGFMRLRGALAGPELFFQQGGLVMAIQDHKQFDVNAFIALLETPAREILSADLINGNNAGLLDYAMLCGESLVSIGVQDKNKYGQEPAVGLWNPNPSLTLFSTSEDDCEAKLSNVRVYGDDSTLTRLKELIGEWEARGRPSLQNAKIVAAPIGSASNHESEFVIRKKWMEYRIDF